MPEALFQEVHLRNGTPWILGSPYGTVREIGNPYGTFGNP
jgi:hypothetical protein